MKYQLPFLITFVFGLILNSISPNALALESAEKERLLKTWESRWKNRKPKDDSTFDVMVGAKFIKGEGGVHEYRYSVSSHPLNKGVIENFILDLSCDQSFFSADIAIIDDRRISSSSEGDENTERPPISDIRLGHPKNAVSITKGNQLVIRLNLEPGKSSSFGFFSSGLTTKREYKLDADKETTRLRQNMWADKTKTDVPWITDYLNEGTISGPGCVASRLPWALATDDPLNIYQGDGTNEETEIDNGLLTYPYISGRDWFVKMGEKVFPRTKDKFVVQYSKFFKPESLVVLLNGQDLTSLFYPAKGGFDQIKLPLKSGKNNLELSASGREGSTGKLLEDKDSFSIEIEEYYYVDKWWEDDYFSFIMDPYHPYPGELTKGENLHVNYMLTYSDFKRKEVVLALMINPMEPDAWGYFTFHYDQFIDPKTLSVTLNKNDITSLFEPRQSYSERVRLPLEFGTNHLELKVMSKSRTPSTLRSDCDSFVIELFDATQMDEEMERKWAEAQRKLRESYPMDFRKDKFDQTLEINGKKFDLE